MVQLGRDLSRLSGPTPCSGQATYNLVHLQPRIVSKPLSTEGHTTPSLANLCQFSATLRVKKCFLMFRGNTFCLSVCAHGFLSCFTLLVPSLQVFIFINWVLTKKSFLQAKQYQSSQSFLPGQKESGPFILFVPLW